MGLRFFAGLDIGSAAVHLAVVGEDRSIAFSPQPRPHQGKPLEALKVALA